MQELINERDSLTTQLSETKELLQREREAALEEKNCLNAVLRQKQSLIYQLLERSQKMNIDSRDISVTPISSEGSFPQREIELFKEIGYGSIRQTTQERYDQTWQVTMKQIRWKEACISRNIGMFMNIKHHNLLLLILLLQCLMNSKE